MREDTKKKQQQSSTIEIINDYFTKTKHRIRDVEKIKDGQKEHKLWIYADDFENSLGIKEERLHYLFVKRRWQEQYDWCDGRRSPFGKLGITIPLAVYEYLQGRKNLVYEFVVCIISDVNRWKYTDLGPYYYYRISLLDMHNFAKKQYTIFKNQYTIYDKQYEEEVIGFPFSLFEKV